MSDFHERRMQMQQEWIDSAKQCEWRGDITLEEVQKHNTKDDLWMVYKGFVYDITQYMNNHPGGTSCLMPTNGHDMTRAYQSVHPYVDIKMIEKLKIGQLKA